MTNASVTPANVIQRTGDLFTSTLPALAQGVNTHGLMGAGIAAEFRRRFSEIYEPYKAACDDKTLLPGGMLPLQTTVGIWTLNLASQDRPGRHARLAWVASSMRLACTFMVERHLSGFAIPRIGAGIGGLAWPEVLTVLETVAVDFPQVTIEIWSQPDAV